MSKELKRFGANIFVEVKAENMEKAKEIIGKIVEAKFEEEVGDAIEQMHFHDGLGNDQVWEIEED